MTVGSGGRASKMKEPQNLRLSGPAADYASSPAVQLILYVINQAVRNRQNSKGE
jgi:hypothetical protein